MPRLPNYPVENPTLKILKLLSKCLMIVGQGGAFLNNAGLNFQSVFFVKSIEFFFCHLCGLIMMDCIVNFLLMGTPPSYYNYFYKRNYHAIRSGGNKIIPISYVDILVPLSLCEQFYHKDIHKRRHLSGERGC